MSQCQQHLITESCTTQLLNLQYSGKFTQFLVSRSTTRLRIIDFFNSQQMKTNIKLSVYHRTTIVT